MIWLILAVVLVAIVLGEIRRDRPTLPVITEAEALQNTRPLSSAVERQ